jgi:putative two-component system response regulator
MQRMRQLQDEMITSQKATIHALTRLAVTRDDDTGSHIERTSSYCKILSQKLYEEGTHPDVINDEYIENMYMASPLHDIGKVGIPDAILLKPGRLTDDEFEVMKTHVFIGYETLSNIVKLNPENEFLKIGVEIARYHHEKWDGGGYMSGVSGDEIPLSARIMALSDVYDALRSKRPYKEPFSHEKAMDIIMDGRGKHFDPALTYVFLENHALFRDVFDQLSEK